MVGLITMALSQRRMNDHGIRLIPGGPKKQKQLNGNSLLTAFVFLDHPVCVDGFYMTGFTRINGDENEVQLTSPCAALM